METGDPYAGMRQVPNRAIPGNSNVQGNDYQPKNSSFVSNNFQGMINRPNPGASTNPAMSSPQSYAMFNQQLADQRKMTQSNPQLNSLYPQNYRGDAQPAGNTGQAAQGGYMNKASYPYQKSFQNTDVRQVQYGAYPQQMSHYHPNTPHQPYVGVGRSQSQPGINTYQQRQGTIPMQGNTSMPANGVTPNVDYKQMNYYAQESGYPRGSAASIPRPMVPSTNMNPVYPNRVMPGGNPTARGPPMFNNNNVQQIQYQSRVTTQNDNRRPTKGVPTKPPSEWTAAKAQDGRMYWYSAKTRETHWYNPDMIAIGKQMLKYGQKNIPKQVTDHLKMYKEEMQQLYAPTSGTSGNAVVAQRNPQEEAQKKEHAALLERQRQEALRLQRERDLQREAEQRKQAEEAARIAQEKRVKAKIAAKSKSKILLRKFLENLGYAGDWVSDEMLREAVENAEPATGDVHENDFDLAIVRVRRYYDRTQLHQERTAMIAEDEYSKAYREDEKAMALSQFEKDKQDRMKKEFEEFFKFRPFKAQGRSTWNQEKTEDDIREEAERKKRKEIERADQLAVAKVQRENKARRAVRSRLTNVDGHMVLKANNYGMNEGIQTISATNRTDLRKQVKSALSPYMIFSSEVGALIREQQPGMAFKDVQKAIAERWKAITPEQQAEYSRKSQEDKERYTREYQAACEEMERIAEELEKESKAKQEYDEFMQQTREETAALESDARRNTPGTPTSGAAKAPRLQLGDIGDAAVIAMGARAGVSLDAVLDWAKSTRVGRMLIGRLKASEFDEASVEKVLRKQLNKGRYTQDKVRGKGKALFALKMSPEALMEIVTEQTYREKKESARVHGASATLAKASKQLQLESARKEHIQNMKDEIFQSNQRQWAFMYRNREAVHPFVSEDVKNKLEYAAKLLREHGHEKLLDEDPSGYDQEDAALRKAQDEASNADSKLDLRKRRKRPTVEQPENIAFGDMRPYQLEGLRWLVHTFENGLNAILADEMGLGKTLQTISFLTHLKFEMEVSGPFLVIVPLSVLTGWANEFQRWSPDMKVVKLHSSSKEERDRLKREILNDISAFDVVITTFEMIISPNMKYILSSKMWWRYVVIDEGHKIKNDNTDLSIAVRGINCQGRLLLTGTPLQNNLHELWALLNYLYPAVFVDSEMFDSCFDLAKQIVETDMLAKAHYLIRPFVLRRTKDEVEQRMPPKEEIEIKIALSDMQKHWYRMLLLKDAKLLERVEASIGTEEEQEKDNAASDWKKLQSLMMQLRKVCNHPYLLPNTDLVNAGVGEDMVEASGKLKMLDRILKRLFEKAHRVVIFSQFTATLNILQDFCVMRNYKVARLDGSTNRVQRAIDISQFNKENSPYFAYLMSTRAGGLGINLATADTVILYDSDWNPQVDMQAMDRVHRIGQTKPVHVYRLLASGTVEERVVQRAKKKLYLDKMVNRGSTSQAEALESLSKAEMLKMLKFGASAVVGGAGDVQISDEELERIMDRTKLDEMDAPEADTKITDETMNALDFDGTTESLSLRELDGVKFEAETPKANLKRGRDAIDEEDTGTGLDLSELVSETPASGLTLQEIAESWAAKHPSMYQNKPKRARTSRYVEIDGYTVLKLNNYALEEGEKSVFADELSMDVGFSAQNTGRQIAGRDYDNEGHCLVCWDGGDLLLCDQCCASYHELCLSPDQLPQKKKNGFASVNTWGCPHHSCKVCGRKAHASGGMLFRCTECPTAYCEDHLPDLEGGTVHLNDNGREARFEALGQRKPPQAYFIQCSKQCTRFANTRQKDGIMAAILEAQRFRDNPELEDEPPLSTSAPEDEITEMEPPGSVNENGNLDFVVSANDNESESNIPDNAIVDDESEIL